MGDATDIEIDLSREIDLWFSDRAPADFFMRKVIATTEPREARHV